jgi:flagellar hook-basal body complex protein FliE
MDPLSALHFAVSPELRAAGLPKAAKDASLQVIPKSELEKLMGSSGPEAARAAAAPPASFESTLGQMVTEVNGKQATANQAVAGMLGGGNVSLHQAMISMEEANVSFQLMVEVRNKLLDSYQELMRMQV